MGFSRQEYWSGLPCHSPGDLPNPEINPGLYLTDSLLFEPPDKLCDGNIVLKVRTRQKGILRSVTLTHCYLLPILPLFPFHFHPPSVSDQYAWFLVYPSVFFCTNELDVHVCLLSFLFLFVGLPMYSEYLVLQ